MKNWDFGVFPKKYVCRGTKACVYCLDFQCNHFSYVVFIVKKSLLFVDFIMPSCAKSCFSQCSTPLMDERFCENVPNFPRNKSMKRLIQNPLNKDGFLAFKTLLFPLVTWKKRTLSPLNIRILQIVKDRAQACELCTSFGGHVEI